jgi:FkbM family methyltransferase
MGGFLSSLRHAPHSRASRSGGEPPSTSQQHAQLVLHLFQGMPGLRYYVDCAANHPFLYSSTNDLERHGWRGLCIEPNPEYSELLRRNRTCMLSTAAIDALERNATFRFAGAMGGIEDDRFDNRPMAKRKDATTTLRTRTLEWVLRSVHAPRTIDYFNLDVEGAEAAVLSATFPFKTFTFLTLSVERPPPELNSRLFRNGYLFVRNVGTDSFYIHHKHPRAYKAARNASYRQVPAKCSSGKGNGRFKDRPRLHGRCASMFGCCAWPGYPESMARYQM